jgi:prepilin-type N-terminal cleavage/methylation domain-containing protein
MKQPLTSAHSSYITESGFTLIELVVVMVMLGILAAYVAPRLNISESNTGSQAELLAQNIRHAQAIAVAQHKTLTVEVASGSYSVKEGASIINDPRSGAAFSVTLEDSVSASTGSVDLDYLGRPLTSGAFITSDTTFTLSGGSVSSTVSVTPVTGFVTVSP